MAFREAIKLDLSLTLRLASRNLQSGFPCRQAIKQTISLPLKLGKVNLQSGFPCRRGIKQVLHITDWPF